MDRFDYRRPCVAYISAVSFYGPSQLGQYAMGQSGSLLRYPSHRIAQSGVGFCHRHINLADVPVRTVEGRRISTRSRNWIAVDRFDKASTAIFDQTLTQCTSIRRCLACARNSGLVPWERFCAAGAVVMVMAAGPLLARQPRALWLSKLVRYNTKSTLWGAAVRCPLFICYRKLPLACSSSAVT